jgi:hypothetical protein
MPPKKDPPLAKGRAAPASVSAADVDTLLEQVKDALDRGQTSENGFKKAIWTPIAAAFNDELRTAATTESKFNRLKKDYKEVKEIREFSGMGWDDVNHLPMAEPSVWKALEKVGCSFIVN